MENVWRNIMNEDELRSSCKCCIVWRWLISGRGKTLFMIHYSQPNHFFFLRYNPIAFWFCAKIQHFPWCLIKTMARASLSQSQKKMFLCTASYKLWKSELFARRVPHYIVQQIVVFVGSLNLVYQLQVTPYKRPSLQYTPSRKKSTCTKTYVP